MKRFAKLGGAIALLFASASAIRADEKPNELSWVPPNCVAFAHVRFAELWDSPAGKAFRNFILTTEPKAFERMERDIGINLAQLDRVTAVIPDAEATDREPGFIIRVVLREPYDRQKLLESLRLEDREQNPRGLGGAKKLFRMGRNDDGYVHLTDAKTITFIISEHGAAGLLSQYLEGEQVGRLSAALKQASEGGHLVAAADLSRLRHVRELARDDVFRPFLTAGLATIAGDLKDGTGEFTLRASFPNAEQAGLAMKALDEMRGKLIKELHGEVDRLRQSRNEERIVEAKLMEAFLAAIKDAKVQTADGLITGSTRFETKDIVEIVAKEMAKLGTFGADRRASQNNLKQIGLAMHNYESAYQRFPAAAICNNAGKPLLSWRVAILPFIEEETLYREFKMDEPWDSEHNKKLIARMPKIYQLPSDKTKHDQPSTYYKLFVGNGAIFDLKQGGTFATITDGTSNTLMAAEAADPVIWTKPDDFEYDPRKAPKLGYFFGEKCNVLFGDGHVIALRKNLPEKTLHWLIQRADGNVIPSLDE